MVAALLARGKTERSGLRKLERAHFRVLATTRIYFDFLLSVLSVKFIRAMSATSLLSRARVHEWKI